MTPEMKTVIYPVKDIAAAKKIYGALAGAAPVADAPYYVGFQVGDQHLGLLPNGRDQGMDGPVAYWHVDDIARTTEALTAAGAKVQQAARDVGGGRLVAMLRDADGNQIGLIQDTR